MPTEFAQSPRPKPIVPLQQIYAPLSSALAELDERRSNRRLYACVEEYLEGDIPNHFRDGPLLYLARHIATPNRETLTFLELCNHLRHTAAIGQDLNDVFVSHNPIKHALGVLPIAKGISRSGHEILEYVTVLDFNSAQGRRLCDLCTFAGQPLAEFHNSLFDHVNGARPSIIDDTEWIDRNHRGNLLEHYKRHLSLFVVHGILFEYFVPLDPFEQRLLSEVVIPAFEFVKERFGVAPLVTPHVTATVRDHHVWDTYPSTTIGPAKAHARRRWRLRDTARRRDESET